MTSDLKCPFCSQELGGNMAEPCCRNQNCEMNAIPIPRTIWEKLDDYEHNLSVKTEQHERGYAYATKTIKDLESKLEIATKAMNQVMSMGAKNNICYHLKAKTVKSILGNALEQIEHKDEK